VCTSLNQQKFPVLDSLAEILNSIQNNRITILQAPPGSGKTTALPLELLKANIRKGKKILMLEPRRIATKNAALRLSYLNGTPVGGLIGYRIRFESKISEHTLLEVVTDGILTKLLLADPELSDYDLVVFDEFHERNLDSDFCLSLVRQVQTHFRDDLKVLIMSATLEGINFKDAGIISNPITTKGKSYPIEIIHQGESNKRSGLRVAELIPKVLDKHEGDILVFFSGISEINEAARELTGTNKLSENTIILRLFGDMNFEDQEKVFLPAKPGERKVILATNLAESSVTISNVRVVIDTGFCKRAIFDPRSGLTKLVRKRISLASAKQRSGRSGREAPGFSYRLWSKEEESNFVTAHPPEILESDISNLILLSKIWGEDLSDLPLIDCPKAGTLIEMSELLQKLGCLDADAKLTELGKQAAQLPMPLRLAVMCLLLKQSGKLELGTDLALAYSERKYFSDVLPLQNFRDVWEKWTNHPNLNSIPKIKMIRDQLIRNLSNSDPFKSELSLKFLDSPILFLTLAYPDRIAKARFPGSNRYKMANGKGAYLPEGTKLHYPEWILILESDGDETDAKISLYLELVEQDILRLQTKQLHNIITHSIEENEKKIPILRSFEESMLGEISYKKTPVIGKNQIKDKKRKVSEYFQKKGILPFLYTEEETKQFCFRIQLLFKNGILEKNIEESYLLSQLENWLFPNYNFEKESLNLFDFKPIEALLLLFSYQEKELLQKEAPSHLTVPSGSKIQINYSEGNPILAVKLQELFGLAQTPCIAKGRVPLALHLLSPAGRPVQVTTDLKSFWDTTYHEVKRELKGRYPRHPWPESPWEAIASRGTKKRSLN